MIATDPNTNEKFFRYTNKNIALGDSVLLVSYPLASGFPFVDGVNSICMNIALNGTPSDPVADPNMANDTVCRDFIIGVTGVNDVKKEAGVNAYPNPAKDYLYWEAVQEVEITDIALYDFTGRQIYRAAHVGKNGEINLTGFAAGSYFIKATHKDNNVCFRQVIIE